MSQVGYLIWALSTLYILSWIPIAYKTGVLFPSQMLEKHPKFDQVIPLVVDSYFWADLLVLSPLLGYVASTIGDQWKVHEVASMLVIGLVAGGLFQVFVIVPGKYPCTLGGAGETSLIGILHIPYFGASMALMLMFLFTSTSTASVLVVAAALAFLAPADILVPLHFIRKWTEYHWIPDVFAEEKRLYWMIGGVECGVASLAGLKLAFQ